MPHLCCRRSFDLDRDNCGYVDLLRQAYPDKRNVSAVLVNFTTDEEQCAYFPSNQCNDVSLLNVRVWLDDPDKNVYYVYEPSAATANGVGAVAQQLGQLSLTAGKSRSRH